MHKGKLLIISAVSGTVLTLSNGTSQVLAESATETTTLEKDNVDRSKESYISYEHIYSEDETELVNSLSNISVNTAIHFKRADLTKGIDKLEYTYKNSKLVDFLKSYLVKKELIKYEDIIFVVEKTSLLIISEKDFEVLYLNEDLLNEQITNNAKSLNYNTELNKEETNEAEANEKEASKAEPNKQEANEAEANKEEPNKQEANEAKANKEEPNKQEANEEEPNKQEVNEAEANEKEAIKEETNKQEAIKEETNKQEANEAELNKEEPNEEEASKEETNEVELNKIEKNQEEREILNTVNASSSQNSFIHTVKAGESLSKIARLYNVKVSQIADWNHITNVNMISVGQKLTIFKNVTPSPDKGEELTPGQNPFKSNQEFIDYVSEHAMNIADDSGLYASVMIAQAILETGYGDSRLSQPPYHNLFGIKTNSSDPHSVYVKTAEQDKEGNEYFIYDYFKTYADYSGSFKHNADKLKNGLVNNHNFYSGTWISNTDGYKDATLWLQGRYATDVKYATKLNRIIEQYNLVKYDLSSQTVDEYEVAYNAEFSSRKTKIYNNPGNIAGYLSTNNSSNLKNNNVIVRKEVLTGNKKWGLVEQNGKTLGWVNLDHLIMKFNEINRELNVNYSGKISSSLYGIFSRPAYTENNRKLRSSEQFLNQTVDVIQEATTSNNQWLLISLNGKELGWINKNGLLIGEDKLIDQVNIANDAIIEQKNFSIHNKPGYIDNYKVVNETSDYINQEVVVRKKAKTSSGIWYLISQDYKNLGWVNEEALNLKSDRILESQSVAYSAIAKDMNYGLFTEPAYTIGNKQVGELSKYAHKKITVRKLSRTDRATWAQIEYNNKIIGWTNSKGLDFIYDSVVDSSEVAYEANIVTDRYGVFTEPAYVENNVEVKYEFDKGQNVVIREEKKTNRATWVLLEVDGTKIGWINKNGIRPDFDEVVERRKVAYDAKVARNWYGVFSKPAYTMGNSKLAELGKYYKDNLIVRDEIVTSRATWVLIEVNGTDIGWVNKYAIQPHYDKQIYNVDVAYAGELKQSRYGIFNTPAYMSGNEQVDVGNNYQGKKVIIRQELKTNRATWVLLEIDGETIGWINKKAVSIEHDKRKTSKSVKYSGKVKNTSFGVFSKPAYTKGNIQVGLVSEYKGKTVNVTKEITTKRATWVLININNSKIGWMNKNNLQ